MPGVHNEWKISDRKWLYTNSWILDFRVAVGLYNSGRRWQKKMVSWLSMNQNHPFTEFLSHTSVWWSQSFISHHLMYQSWLEVPGLISDDGPFLLLPSAGVVKSYNNSNRLYLLTNTYLHILDMFPRSRCCRRIIRFLHVSRTYKVPLQEDQKPWPDYMQVDGDQSSSKQINEQ